MTPDYTELHCISNFTFLRGASHPEELVERAAALGYSALAVTDECSLAGVVRAHLAAKRCGLHLILGSELRLDDGLHVVLLAADHAGYSALSRLITRGRRAADKGGYQLTRADLEPVCEGWLALWLPPADETAAAEQGAWLAEHFAGRAWIAVELLREGDDEARLTCAERLAQRFGLPRVAAGDVHMHRRGRRALQDTMTAIRLGCRVDEAGFALHPNGERHLRPREALAELYPSELLAETVRVAGRCRFSLDELEYRYPAEINPDEQEPSEYLRRLTEEGMARRWPGGAPADVREQVDEELAIIAELGYEPYFLTVRDLVAFARGRGILCQGRGSAANSAVCYCLGITEVDPGRGNTLFARFVSRERGEPPDIDVDFEHDRREEVIQYVYERYGRRRAALAATVICYRPRSAIRDVAKALGFSAAQVEALAGAMQWWDGSRIAPERLREAGFDPDSPPVHRLAVLVGELVGMPRHLSQHVGGFVIADQPVDELVPVENAAMEDRTMIEWDKDDLDALGLLKVDVLGLGMLTAIRRAFELIEGYRGTRWTLASVPAEDPAVYEMIQRADTMGVFQIESRAQMAMLPRLRPERFYDLVIEVAIVRPGPIQGEMVHPYLARRAGEEAVEYPDEAIRRVLERTLGVPIFQEQAMQLAMVAAGFSADEADQLRRAMAAWKKRGGLEPFERRLIDGMQANGYSEDFGRRIFNQLRGFGEYGFPESHAASFALLVYVSAWLKRHEPAAFCAALLNSQPMGFYGPDQLVRDARRHGVEVRPVDALHSDWDCTLEGGAEGGPALRLGLRLVKGLSVAGAQRLVAARDEGLFSDVADLAGQAALGRPDLESLASAGALAGLAGDRHRSRWAVAAVGEPLPLFDAHEAGEAAVELPEPSEGQDLVADYDSLGLTLGRHPMALMRRHFPDLPDSAALADRPHGAQVRVAGIVINRQRPGSAGGVTFMTLEDEAGGINVIVWSELAERARRVLLGASLMVVEGELQSQHGVRHLLARELEGHDHLLGGLTIPSRDFH